MNLRLEYAPDEKPPFAFCEPNWAGSQSRWCLRKITDAGLKFTGGVDTASLCTRVPVSKGWDLPVRITEAHLTAPHACPKCVAAYRALQEEAKSDDG